MQCGALVLKSSDGEKIWRLFFLFDISVKEMAMLAANDL